MLAPAKVSLEKIKNDFGQDYLTYLLKNAKVFLTNEKLIIESNILKTTLKGKFFCDGIASELFWID